ncbi:hypothetical protein ACH5RR_021311 [Cinchona calisaya]|uniref:MULE transposase domain-containing protein n=1 Tax=Cinchona calisaya TaxID=153742 RepID=A0ABD2ZJT9_9GENT
MLQGYDGEEYGKLWKYCNVLRKKNPGSCLKIKFDRPTIEEKEIFQRLYYRLSTWKDGFLAGFRPIIGLDRCFLKDPFGGQLLSAISRDGNGNMYPITLVVVEAKMYDSWRWFLNELRTDIGIDDGVGWSFISDRQKGIVRALEEEVSSAEKRYCLRHLYQNFNQKFKGKELKDLFWKVASSTNPQDFNRAMEELEKADPKVKNTVSAAGRDRKSFNAANFATRGVNSARKASGNKKRTVRGRGIAAASACNKGNGTGMVKVAGWDDMGRGVVAGMVGRGSTSTSSTFDADTGSSATPVGSTQQGIGKSPAGSAQTINKKVHSKK